MADELTTGDGPAAFHCPWCSAALPSVELEICPSCKATLTSTGTAEATLPGVTAIDHEALLRSTREARPPRNRLLSWISGEYVDESETPAQPEAIAPPDIAVRREILRLEIEAEIADKQAEADSILADAAVEGRTIPGLEEVEETAGTEEDDTTEDVLAAQADDGGAAPAGATPAEEETAT